MTKQFFTTGETARILGVKIHQIAYAVSSQHVGDASHIFMHKKMWSKADVERLRQYFDEKKSRGDKDEK